MKKIFWTFFIGTIFISLFLVNLRFTYAQDETDKIEMTFFYSQTCPHCAKEKVFLENLEQKYSQLEIKKYELFDKESQKLVEEKYSQYQVKDNQKGMVPITFLGEKYFLGYRDDETSGKEIEEYFLSLIGQGSENNNIQATDATTNISGEKVKIPFLGEVETNSYSLPALAVILGFFDGFNVCSLGALVLILGIVLTFGSRKKTFILGSVFILTTAIAYGLLIFLWHQIFLAITPYMRKMEILIGLLAIFGGLYFGWQFIKARKESLTCGFGGISQKLSGRLQKFLEKKTNLFALIGAVLLFAGVITIIEFPCSAVLPVLFASILAQANISSTTSIMYIALFLLFYMLDEIIIFLIAFFTMKISITSPKFVIWSNFCAAVILLLLGFYYIFGIV